MFYLVRMNLPFWEILDSNSDEGYLEELCTDVDMDVVDDEALASLRKRHPQARMDYVDRD